MQIELTHQNRRYRADLAKPLDISIPLQPGLRTVNCFFAPPMEVEPVISGNFIGSTARGGDVNFFNVCFNPHGNGTHTECVGHIAKETFTINKSLDNYHFLANLVSVYPRKTTDGDRVIFRDQLEEVLHREIVEALIVRTLPNDVLKLRTNYSGSNPPYVHHEAISWLVEKGVDHLLVDLPSIDREEDEGRLLAHRAFWKYPDEPRRNSTISELIFVNNSIADGLYLLNIQIASFEIDVSPSNPVLYKLKAI